MASASEARWSTSVWVIGTRASTFFLSEPRFLAMKVLTWPRAVPSSLRAALRFFLSSARKVVTVFSCCSALRTLPSFFLSIVVKPWRYFRVSNRSPLLLSRVLVALPNCSMESPMALPLPSRFFAPVSRAGRTPRSRWPLLGPSAVDSSVMEAYSSSTSTGVALRAAGSTAPSASRGPPS